MRRFLPPWINSVTDAVKGSALVSLRRRRRPDAGDPAGDRPHLRADAALHRSARSSISSSTTACRALSRRLEAPLRLYPGVMVRRRPTPLAAVVRIRGLEQVLRQQPGAERRRSRRRARRGRDHHRSLGQRQDDAAALRQLARDLRRRLDQHRRRRGRLSRQRRPAPAPQRARAGAPSAPRPAWCSRCSICSRI